VSSLRSGGAAQIISPRDVGEGRAAVPSATETRAAVARLAFQVRFRFEVLQARPAVFRSKPQIWHGLDRSTKARRAPLGFQGAAAVTSTAQVFFANRTRT